jgi:putative membrane protein
VLELLFAVLLGIGLGTVAGLLPGLHPNTMIPLMLAVAAWFDPLTAAVVLVTTGVVNSFVSFIPAILLGAPDDAEAMSVLPGHSLMLSGRGYEAIKLTVMGGIGATALGLVLLPVMWVAFPAIYSFTRPWLHVLLTTVVAYMVLTEQSMRGKFWAALTFILAGLLGLLALDGFGDGALFPLLTGLFGLPMLLLSLRSGVVPPSSVSYESDPMPAGRAATGITIGALSGVLVGLLPGIGSSQAAVLAQEAVGRSHDRPAAQRTFLLAIGGVAMADVIYSMLALWLVGNPRSGISVAVEQLVTPTPALLWTILAVVVLAAGAGAYITIRLARTIMPLLRRIDYRRLNAVVIAFLILLVGLFTGISGLLVMAVAAAIGLVPNLTGIRRSHAMGCLLLPTILFFAGLAT